MSTSQVCAELKSCLYGCHKSIVLVNLSESGFSMKHLLCLHACRILENGRESHSNEQEEKLCERVSNGPKISPDA